MTDEPTQPTPTADEPADLRAHAVQGLRWVLLVRPVIEVVLLGSMIVLARLVPPADFGRLAVATIAAELAGMIPAESIGTALVQRASVTRAHLKAGFALALLMAFVMAGATLLVAETAVVSIFGERTAYFVRLTLPIFFLSAVATVPLAVLRRRLAFRTLSIIDISTTVVRAAATVVLAVAGLDGESVLLGGIMGATLAVVIAMVVARPPLPRLRRAPARELLEYGLPAGLASASWVGFRNCDYAIVGARLGVLQAGYYFRAYTLAVEYQKKVSLVMGQIGFPLLARASTPEQRAAMRAEMVRVLTMTLFPCLVLLAVLAPELVPWLFGPAWAPATTATQILALGGAATLVIDAAGAVLQADGRARALLGYGIAHFVVYAAAVLVASRFGLVGVAIGAAVVHVSFLWIAYALMLRSSAWQALACLWHDVEPAGVSSSALAVVAVPATLGAGAVGLSPPVLMGAVVAVSLPVYLLTLRLAFPEAWRPLRALVVRLLPVRRLRARTPAVVTATGSAR
jgi:PST family polysaccharide transporter